jgi:PAS domain S-box-containing protein
MINKTILIVDDTYENLYLLKVILEEVGYIVIEANDGSEGLKKLYENNNIDLIISDILMPIMDGFMFCQACKKEKLFKNIPFVFYTSTYTEKLDEDFALKLGAAKFLRKPIDHEEVILTLKNIFGEVNMPFKKVEKAVLKNEDVFKLYNERLIKKLERKSLDLEKEIIVRKKSEELLIESKTYLDNIINNIGDPIFVKDFESRLLLVNDAFCKVFNLDKAEILGKTLAEDVTPEERDEFLKIDLQVLSTGVESINEESLTVREGKKRIISTKKTRFIDQNGNKYLIGIIRDITEKLELERQFMNAFIDAQEVEKQAFGEDLHDGISQILSAEAMYIDILIENNEDRLDDKAKFLMKIKELNISALKDVRNIAHGLIANQLKEGGLLKAIEHICIDFNNSRDINFNLTHKGLVEADFAKEVKTNIYRIIQEISTNTLRHSSAKKATIKMSKVGKDSLKLIIKDNGVGLDLEKMNKDNWGAGLKNIERRVTLLKGVLKLDSEPNKGTCYTITVPLYS